MLFVRYILDPFKLLSKEGLSSLEGQKSLPGSRTYCAAGRWMRPGIRRH